MQQNLHKQNKMYVTPILLLLLASNAFTNGSEDWQALFSNAGINTKETSCEVQNFKINLDSLLNMANGQQNENAPELTPLIVDCPKYHRSTPHRTSFKGALDRCKQLKMRLATPDTKEKYRCLKDYLKLSGSTEDYWIDASNINSVCTLWQTTLEDATDLLNSCWAPGYPSGRADVCVTINAATGLDAPELTPLTVDCNKYRFHRSTTQKTSFKGALQFCKQFMMRLATPDTHEKYRCLKNLLKLADSTRDYWIAASNENTPYFIWQTTLEDATDLLKCFWEPGYPSGRFNASVFINAMTGLVKDDYSSLVRFYVCEEY